jgi:peptide/nickel transport system ATP-binding protein
LQNSCPILSIRDLTIHFMVQGAPVYAVQELSFDIGQGATWALAGESGSGKSTIALAIMGLLPPTAVVSGQIWLQAADMQAPINLLQLPVAERRVLSGRVLSMIFQEPASALNPVLRCGQQIIETLRQHQKLSEQEAKSVALQWLKDLQFDDPQRIFDSYPHQISGGQCQRVMVAIALCCHPHLLLADEPTTALDTDTQREIVDLLRNLQQKRQFSLLFISHDLDLVQNICQQVLILHDGKKVETGPTDAVFQNPQHPYTRGLLGCRPQENRRLRRMPMMSDFLEGRAAVLQEIPPEENTQRRAFIKNQPVVLEVQNATIRYPVQKNLLGSPTRWLDVIQGVSFALRKGETLGIAGASGSGKSSLARALVRMTPLHEGGIFWHQNEVITPLHTLSDTQFTPFRQKIQLVFQDAKSALNPLKTIGAALEEPLRIHRLYKTPEAIRSRVNELLSAVHLSESLASRYPHELSGGQRQRANLARALSVEPQVLICDEVVSALDVSTQGAMLNLLADLQAQFGLSILFISHDRKVLHQCCDHILYLSN